MNILPQLTIVGHERRWGPSRQAGATMIEFALISPLAIVLVLGIIQIGLMFSAKEVINEAAFLAARAGSVQNAQLVPMKRTLTAALVPFYQDTTNTQDAQRLISARFAAATATGCYPENLGPCLPTSCVAIGPCILKVELLNPSPEAFDDFGVTGSQWTNQVYIPNDNLEYRPHSTVGAASHESIHDANALKIKVTYGYEIKVPLMQTVFKAIMCGIDSGVEAFGRGDNPQAGGDDCTNYYSQGRIPIVAYATVQMQTPAWQQN